MKTQRIQLALVSIALAFATAAVTNCNKPRPVEPAAHARQYTCPMHPDVVTNTPGKCPKCGMELVPKP